MSLLRFCHPRKLTEREVAQYIGRIMSALRHMAAERAAK